MTKGIFIAATGQHVGKSTISLGLMAGLQERYKHVGFIKPVGQQHVQISPGVHVDKDVDLIRDFFHLKSPYEEMSPVLIPKGFTRDVLDKKISTDHLLNKIQVAYKKLESSNTYIVAEGTGHVGVGSVVGLNNAQVAAALGLDIVLLAAGGIGSAFDSLALNKSLCDFHGVKLRGVILNKVLPAKKEMIVDYFSKALEPWGVPLLGCIPYNEFLSTPSMADYESLFNNSLMSGQRYRFRHFTSRRMVATSLENFQQAVRPNQLIMTPATREDIILTIVEKHLQHRMLTGGDFGGGLILTGRRPPSSKSIEQLWQTDIPALHAPVRNYDAMTMISTFTAKTRKEDQAKIEAAIKTIQPFINFDLLSSSK